MPERPPDTTELTAISTLDAVPGLRLADREWRALASMRHPVKVALWLALLRPSEELFARESLEETTRGPSPSNEGVGGETTNTPEASNPPGEGSTPATTQDSRSAVHVPELASIPAVIAWAEAAVRKGIRGDMQAWALVADRIEGKVGTRRDEVDPEEERRRGDIQAVIESVVTGLVNARLSGPDDDSLLDVTLNDTGDHTPARDSSLDNERQDRDTARRNELAGAAQRDQEDNQGRGSSLAQTNEEPEERDLTVPDEDPRRPNGHG